MGSLARWVASHSWTVLAGVFLLTVVAAAGVVDPWTGEARLRMDASTASLFPDDDGRAEFYESVRRRFGDDDTMLVVLETPDLFTQERLQLVVDTTQRIEALPGVHGVLSLASAVGVRGDEFEMEVRSPLTPVPRTQDALARLRAQVLEHPLWAGTLVSRDGGAAALVVTFDQNERELLESGLARRVAEVAGVDGEEGRGDVRVLATGTAYVRLALTEAVLRDLRLLVPLVASVLCLVLALTLRSIRGVLVPLATIAAGVTWMLGTLGWMGVPLTLVTAVLPPLLLTVGFTYALHVATASEISNEVVTAVLFAGLTTAIAFLALVLSPIQAIREFGIFAALGIAYIVVASLTLGPALCTLLPVPRSDADAEGGLLERAAEQVAHFDARHRRPVLGIAAIVFVLACSALAHVQTGMDPVMSFRPEAPERVALERIKERFGGVSPLSVVLEAPRNGTFAEPETLREVESLAEWLRADPDVAHVTSVAELLRLLHTSATGDAQAGLPNSRRMARQLLLLAAGPEQRGLIDSRQRSVRLVVRARAEDSATLLPLVERIEARVRQLPEPLSGGVTGTFVLLSRAGDALARGQLRSLLAAVGVIYIVLAFMFGSARVGAIAFLPNALAIAVFFGLLAASGVPLNPTTGLIACTALGIAVDGTIHYLVHYKAAALQDGALGAADATALRKVIRPVTCATFGLCAGFGSMWYAELQDHVRFGWLAAATLGVAWLALVTVAPALAGTFHVLGPWERIVAALGQEPARAVPFFSGRSRRELRRLLRGAQFLELPADERLIAAGEESRALFLVLAGELIAVDAQGGAFPRAKFGRGDVVGRGREPAERCEVVAHCDVQLVRIPVRR